MTNDFYRTGMYHTDHSVFGGKIYNGDFDAHYSMRDMAARISSDLRFDEQCRKNAEIRDQSIRR